MSPNLNRVLYDVCAPMAALLFITAFLLVVRHLVGSTEATEADLAIVPKLLVAGIAVICAMLYLRRKASETTVRLL